MPIAGKGQSSRRKLRFQGFFGGVRAVERGLVYIISEVLTRFEEHIYLAFSFRVDLPHHGCLEQRSTLRQGYYILLILILNRWHLDFKPRQLEDSKNGACKWVPSVLLYRYLRAK